jgi:hypothetical protein
LFFDTGAPIKETIEFAMARNANCRGVYCTPIVRPGAEARTSAGSLALFYPRQL